MKRILLLACFVLVLAALLVQWRLGNRALATAAMSSSQIYIHGTPVCVMKHGEAIVARVGECGSLGGTDEDGEFSGGSRFHESPGGGLPPGHPPVSPDMSPDVSNRVAI